MSNSGVHPLAQKILRSLQRRQEAAEVVLGGYFALQQYTSYRSTRDIDAWWRVRATERSVEAIREVMREIAQLEGVKLSERQFGETISFEFVSGDSKVFSFQIAARSITLEDAVVSEWPPILIETLRDNVGSKMSALVNRGAPRDFTDIFHVVTENLFSVDDSWNLWSRKNPDQTIQSAKQRVLLTLEALKLRRPLGSITNSAERAKAEQVRRWFEDSFLPL